MSNFVGGLDHTIPVVHPSRPVPLSPPEKGQDSFNALHGTPTYRDPEAEVDPIINPGYSPNGRPGSGFLPRRALALPYPTASDLRGYARSPRNLVVVIPPPDFPLDQGQLGNVLSMGPRHRLSQGILMPLFPTMHGQLNAIAREFNFPSTVGICLYFHIAGNGATMTPRISDDSWNYLWGHLFEDHSPLRGQQLPIGGSIEFDIDLDKARWFDAWVSGALRDAESMLPRQFESQGLQSATKYQNVPHSPPLTQTTSALSSIKAVPQTAKADLELLVTSWRANAQLDPASMVESYQPAPDVSTAVTAAVMDEYALEHDASAANPTGYGCSLTSAGPSSLVESTASSSHLPVPISPSRGDPLNDDGWAPPDQLLCPESLQRGANNVDSMPVTSSVWGSSFGWRSATTWRRVYPYSVHHGKPIIRSLLQGPGGLLPQYPNLVIYPDVYPSLTIYPHVICDAPLGTSRPTWGSSFGWQMAQTWRGVWPYPTSRRQAPSPVFIQLHGLLLPHYPHMSIYPAVYPYLDIYPACIHKGNTSQPAILTPGESGGSIPRRSELMTHPLQLGGYSPSTEINETMPVLSAVNVQLSMSETISFYPNIIIYPVIYPIPHLDCPSAVKFTDDSATTPINIGLSNAGGLIPRYPNLTIYPSTYPYIEIYPAEELVAAVYSPVDSIHEQRKMMIANAIWGSSFGWQKATTWLRVWPLHAADTGMAGREGVSNPCGATAVWGSSFGWKRASTWRNVYPLSQTEKVQPNISLVREYPDLVIYPPVYSSYPGGPVACGSQAVWGSSFGWKNAKTWRMVWPISDESEQPSIVPISVTLAGLSSTYPDLVIYPAAYPHFDIYPAVAKPPELNILEGSLMQAQPRRDLIPCYPNLVIYPAVYPHFDLYRPLNAIVRFKGVEKSHPSLRHRHIEAWRARTSGQTDVTSILANNQHGQADEPSELNLADYVTPAGPPSPPFESPSSTYRLPSVHIDRRLGGSVLPSPTTATRRGSPDDGWHPEGSMGRLPTPDLGQRMLDDDEAENQGNAVRFSTESSVYPDLVIYPAAYPHFDLYPARMKVSFPRCESGSPFLQNPVYDIDPTVYPHFNLYPSVDIHVKARTEPQDVHHLTPVRVTFTPVYPAFDLYPFCYPHNLDCIYPGIVAEEGEKSVNLPCSYPWLVIYQSVYPFVTPYPTFTAEIGQPNLLGSLRYTYDAPTSKSVDVKLSVQYPAFDLYPVVYPWNLANIYPSVTIDDHLNVSVRLSSRYPWIDIYPSIYPFVQPYPHIAGAGGMRGPSRLDNSERFRRFPVDTQLEGKFPELIALHNRYPAISPYQVVYPHFELYPNVQRPDDMKVDSKALKRFGITLRHPTEATSRKRKTHVELHASVSRFLEKQPARIKKTHLQLHNEVLKNGIFWTPSGYMQDLAPLAEKRQEETPREARRHDPPHQESLGARPQRSRSATVITRSPDRIVFPLGQPPVMPPIPPLRVRSPGVPSQPSPAVSESPMPRNPSTTRPTTPTRTAGSRLSQVVRSMIPGVHKRNSTAALRSSASHKDHSSSKDRQAPMRFLSLSRGNAVVPPLPNSPSDFLSRPPVPTPQ